MYNIFPFISPLARFFQVPQLAHDQPRPRARPAPDVRAHALHADPAGHGRAALLGELHVRAGEPDARLGRRPHPGRGLQLGRRHPHGRGHGHGRGQRRRGAPGAADAGAAAAAAVGWGRKGL